MIERLLTATALFAVLAATPNLGLALSGESNAGSETTRTETARADTGSERPVVVETEAPPPAARELVALRADMVHLGDGRSLEGATVLLENGRVRAVGKDLAVPEGTPVQVLKGHLAPGFVLANSYLLPGNERFDSTRAFLPDASIVHAFRADTESLSKALRAGVTTVLLSPAENNAVGGRTAVVKTAGKRVLSPGAHLSVSLSTAAVDDRRYPTSFSGLVGELRRLLTAGEGAYGEVKGGKLPLLVYARDRHQVVRAVELGREFGIQGVLVGASLAGEQLELLQKSGWTVVFDTPGAGASERMLDAMAAYAAGGAPFAFSYSNADDLRFAAAQLLRRGVSPDVLMRALTSGGASAAGVAANVGRLERGLDGDMVLWSGHPLELTSSPRAVYVDGVLVHRAKQTDRETQTPGAAH